MSERVNLPRVVDAQSRMINQPPVGERSTQCLPSDYVAEPCRLWELPLSKAQRRNLPRVGIGIDPQPTT